jgi:hypothetical protein
MIEVRNAYYAHMLPYSLSLSGTDAPMPDTDRANLCAALGADYCSEARAPSALQTRNEKASRNCAVTWAAAGVALVRCDTDAARALNNRRTEREAATLGQLVAQQPPPSCSSQNELENEVTTDTFTDHTGAKWSLHARSTTGCDWVLLSLTRNIPTGTLTFVRGAPSAYTGPAAMHLKALTAIQNTTTTPTSQEAVLAEAGVRIEVTR